MQNLVFGFIVNACRQADAFDFLLIEKRREDVMKNKKPQIFVRHELQRRAERGLHKSIISAAFEKIYFPLLFRAST